MSPVPVRATCSLVTTAPGATTQPLPNTPALRTRPTEATTPSTTCSGTPPASVGGGSCCRAAPAASEQVAATAAATSTTTSIDPVLRPAIVGRPAARTIVRPDMEQVAQTASASISAISPRSTTMSPRATIVLAASVTNKLGSQNIS